jgi:hypothetical protein
MREDDRPRIVEPLVELDGAGRRLGLKVGCNASKAEGGHG